MSEREIIQALRRSSREKFMQGIRESKAPQQEDKKLDESVVETPEKRIDEARRGPVDIFLAQLEGTLNRIEAVNKKYNTPAQQKLLDEFIIDHLRFLSLNKDTIIQIINTPGGTPSGVNMRDFLFESALVDEERLAEAKSNSPIDMFFREFDELMARAKQIDGKLNDAEQNKEFDAIVMSRLEYIKRAEAQILKIMHADPEINIETVVRQLRSRLKYSKKKVKIMHGIPVKPVLSAKKADEDVVATVSKKPSFNFDAIERALGRLPFDTPYSGFSPERNAQGGIEVDFRDAGYFEYDEDRDLVLDYKRVISIVKKALGPLANDVKIDAEDHEKNFFTIYIDPK